MIITNVEGLRDPFMLVENGVYYLYGTGVSGTDWDHSVWDCYINDSGSLLGTWKRVEELVYTRPALAQKQLWAPEVHKYKGKYYLLGSYFSSVTQHRGCCILSATSPTGPFTEITNGHITPENWDAIDSTLFVDADGQPWLIFVHEWTSTDDKVGRMAAAKLSDDLTHFISQPVELFRADSSPWTSKRVTDGCFMHTLENGKCLMLWSNYDADGYCLGIVHNPDGKLDGQWQHEDKPLIKRGVLDHHDGGHGMLFTDTDGQKYICCHSPNKPCEECRERTILIPVVQTQDTLRIQ